MRKLYCLIGFLIVLISTVNAQDEGTIMKRERLQRSTSVYLGLGPSFTFGKNIGDYSVGLNGEVGYIKRLNRVLSIGPSLSFLSFAYDQEKTGANSLFQGDDYVANDGHWHRPGLYIDFEGGDINLLSLGFTVKLNFVPVKDDSRFSVYAFAKPFVSFVNRTEVTGDAVLFEIIDSNDDDFFDEDEVAEAEQDAYEFEWSHDNPDLELSKDLKEQNSFTGGIFIGPGVELNPGRKLSAFLQVSIGYTLPVSYTSTEKYRKMDPDRFDGSAAKFPMTKEGFPSLNIQGGISFNF
jgi:hypothetical protein